MTEPGPDQLYGVEVAAEVAPLKAEFLDLLEADRAALLMRLAALEDVLIRNGRLKKRTKEPTHAGRRLT